MHRGWLEYNSLAKLGDEYKTMAFPSLPESLKPYSGDPYGLERRLGLSNPQAV